MRSGFFDQPTVHFLLQNKVKKQKLRRESGLRDPAKNKLVLFSAG
jgi:hypothetical protein